MAKIDDLLDYEEDFFSKGKRENRKERRLSQAKDRSKYRKSDRDQNQKKQNKEEPPLGAGLKRGRILSISPECITVAADCDTYTCTLKGTLKKEKTKQKNLIAVGDWIHFEVKSQNSGAITHVEKRSSFLGRSDNLSRRKQQLIAVNIDQIFIVMSVVLPKFKPLLVDRYIISAKKGNMKPIILINKIDFLTNPPENISADEVEEEKRLLEEFQATYRSLDIPVFLVSCSTGENIDQLRENMQKQTSVFSGQSGVGKSSLINAIIGTNLPIGAIVKKTQKGSHTTTSARLIAFERNGFCVDTPGIKSFGVWDLLPEEIIENFPEFYRFAAYCRFPNCSHLHEPGCSVKEALEKEKISSLRYASYVTLMGSKSPKEWE